MVENRKHLRIGIIGAGAYACSAHLPVFQKTRGVRVVAACRSHEQRLKKTCERFKIPSGYLDYHEMLDKEDLDGVLIASPHANHYEHAHAALEHGIAVLLEKPMTLEVKHAKELVELAQKRRLPLLVGYNRHYWLNFKQARELIQDGELGELRFICARWVADIEWALAQTKPPDWFREHASYGNESDPNFRGNLKASGGGMFIDGGTHMADAILWTTGLQPATVWAIMDNRGYQTDCDTAAVIQFKGGAIASCGVMGATKSLIEHDLVIHGTDGSVFLNDKQLIIQRNGKSEDTFSELGEYSSPAANFIGVLAGDEQPICDGVDGWRAVVLTQAVYESASRGKTVTISQWPQT
ncbi:MAG: Gfo/Idh/MocA family oxidoreductase [bacterium]